MVGVCVCGYFSLVALLSVYQTLFEIPTLLYCKKPGADGKVDELHVVTYMERYDTKYAPPLPAMMSTFPDLTFPSSLTTTCAPPVQHGPTLADPRRFPHPRSPLFSLPRCRYIVTIEYTRGSTGEKLRDEVRLGDSDRRVLFGGPPARHGQVTLVVASAHPC